MQRILTRYAGWFNRKYDRIGILIANRFKSEPVETEEYFLTLLRYIHQNSVKAGIAKSAINYKWSSLKDYIKKSEFTDTSFLTTIIDTDSFIEYNNEEDMEVYEISAEDKKKDDFYVKNRIKEILRGADSLKLGELPKKERDKIISFLKSNEKFTIRQIERATGISRGVIFRCK